MEGGGSSCVDTMSSSARSFNSGGMVFFVIGTLSVTTPRDALSAVSTSASGNITVIPALRRALRRPSYCWH
jgi:hypothetical protein